MKHHIRTYPEAECGCDVCSKYIYTAKHLTETFEWIYILESGDLFVEYCFPKQTYCKIVLYFVGNVANKHIFIFIFDLHN